jgi:hypothetical protein
MRIRENLSSVVASIGKNNASSPKKNQVGRVYGVVTTENTPTKEMFEKAGGFNGIGSIFYLDYAQSKNTIGNTSNNFLDTCNIAKPLHPQFQYYPVLGELVFLGLRCAGFILTMLALTSLTWAQIPLLVGAFSCAWVLGLVVPGAPGGLGVFETTAMLLLQYHFPAALVISAIALYRLISIIAETTGAALAWLNEWKISGLI